MKKNLTDEARLLALQVLIEVNENGAFSNESLNRFFVPSGLDARERAFATALVYGTLSRQYGLDIQIDRFSAIPVDDMDPEVRNILRLGAWQIYHSFSVPANAAVDESVKLCRFMGKTSATGLVNAVLREMTRNKPFYNRKETGPSLGLSKEMFGFFRKWYGEETAIAIAESFLNRDFSITIRVNPKKNTAEELSDILENEGCAVSDGLWLERALRIDTGKARIDELESFKAGRWMVQDEAAQLVGAVSHAEQVLTVLDLCAAPGGKTLDLAERLPADGTVLGIDISDERLEKARENARRMESNVEFMVADATDEELFRKIANEYPVFQHGADLVLVDVPCSGLGLLGRKPEIRQRISYEEIKRFPPLQDQILQAASLCVKKSGRLIYSTCTLNPEENEERIRAFLGTERGRDFIAADDLSGLPRILEQSLRSDASTSALLDEGMILLRPDLSKTDGFFIAVLERKG